MDPGFLQVDWFSVAWIHGGTREQRKHSAVKLSSRTSLQASYRQEGWMELKRDGFWVASLCVSPERNLDQGHGQEERVESGEEECSPRGGVKLLV